MTLRDIAIRITADNDTALGEFLSQYPALACKEGPDMEKHCRKDHYHIYLQSKLTNEGLKKQIYKLFETPDCEKGNQFLAFSRIITDEEHKNYKGGLDGYLRYICKGKEKTYPNIVFNSLDYNTDDYYERYWEINYQYKEDAKTKREAKRTNKQNFKDWFISNHVNSSQDIGKHTMSLTKKNICIMMYNFYKDNEWELPSPSQGEIIVNDLYFRFSDNHDLEKEILNYYRIFENPYVNF